MRRWDVDMANVGKRLWCRGGASVDLEQMTVGTLTFLSEDDSDGPLLVTCYFDLGLEGDPAGFLDLQGALKERGFDVHVVMLVDPSDLLHPSRAVLRGLRRQQTGRPLLEHLRKIPGGKGHTYRRDQGHTGGALPHAHVFDRKLREIGAFNSDGSGHDKWKGSQTVLPRKVFQGLGQVLPSDWTMPPEGMIENLTGDHFSELLLG